jgi:hypothetical protein
LENLGLGNLGLENLGLGYLGLGKNQNNQVRGDTDRLLPTNYVTVLS